MNLKGRLPAIFVVGFFILGGVVIANRYFFSPVATTTIDVKVPTFSPIGRQGEQAFSTNCAACHGVNAAGTQKGPPLVHDLYNPGHHADGAFVMAARRGVQSHHWPYGNMPPQPQVTNAELQAIIRYVRELQVANGIRTRKHRM